MKHKCIDNGLFEDIDHSHHHNEYDDAAFLPFDETVARLDYEKLGRWILQAQDGVINNSDFRTLQHCLLTDTHALRYYVEFMWLSARLHTLFHEKQPVLT
jgi:hypothetical protein